MISRRVADHPLGALNDDLSLALQRIQFDLDAYQQEPTESTPLEAMTNTIGQIRGPLVTLEQRKAVTLLDEMRLLTVGLIKGKLPASFDPTVLRQAVTCLAHYLESCLIPDARPADSTLVEMIDTLRRARQQDVPSTATVSKVPIVSSDVTRESILDELKQLRKTVADAPESVVEQPEIWESLQRELVTVHRMLAGQEWTRAALASERLGRIAGALATDAEHYRLLAIGVFGEIFVALCHYLEPLGNERPAAGTVLNEVENYLTQLETLLALPARSEPLTSDLALAPTHSVDSMGNSIAVPDLPLILTGPSDHQIPVADLAPAVELELELELEQKPVIPDETLSSGLPTPDLGEYSNFALDSVPPVASEEIDLIDLLDLKETDPEFIEVFLEEARGELIAIREQLINWRSNFNDRDALTTIRRAFHTLKGSGRMVGATVIGDFAWEYENLLNQVLSGTLNPSMALCDAVAAAVSALAPLVGEIPPRGGELDVLPTLIAQVKNLPFTQAEEAVAPPAAPVESTATSLLMRRTLRPTAPSPVISPPAPATPLASAAVEIDPEFLEVFLEEAREELDRIREQRIVWQRNLTDHEALTTIRRAFHTLKGSGRLVGATEIGEFALEFENLLNRVLSEELPASTAIADLVGEAANVLDRLVGNEPVTDQTKPMMAALVEQARALSPAVLADTASTPPAPAQPPEVVLPSVPAQPAEVALPPALTQPSEVVRPAPAQTTGQVPPPVVPEQAATSDLELAQVFQYEATEILDASDLILQRLATETDQTVLLNDLRRNMHTLKGSSRLSGLLSIGDLAHAAESVLDALSKTAGRASSVVLDALQQTVDYLNRMVAEAAGGASPAAATKTISGLHRLADALAAGEPITELSPVLLAVEPTPAEPISKRRAATPPSEPAAFQTMTELDQELVQVFQTEASEILDSSDAILARLRGDPTSTELLNNLRREMHTLKGGSRMAGFMTVGELAHAAESVLDALGKGTLKGSSRIMDLIQRALDGLHQMLAGVLSGAQLPTQRELIEELHGVLGARPIERSKPLLPAVTATLTAAAAAAVSATQSAEKPAAASAVDSIRVSATLLNTLVNQMGESSIFRARIDQGVSAMSFNLNELEQTIVRLRRQVTNLATQAEARIQSRHDQDAKTHQLEFDPLELDRFTELQQVSRSLMEVADDLSNIGNALGEHAREVSSLLDQQGKVNKEIQQGLMRTGMVRFGGIVSRLRRVVRQSAQELGKRAELLVGGEDAEVDRSVLENMIAPLEHMLRNSLAHGIEPPELRRERGKPEIGTITLSLRREGAELVLELNDDGSGLNFDAIRAKGEEKGLLSPGQTVTDEELIALLLRPGFSTATSVTQISGRGVGMDVVSEAIRAMRGALLIQTEAGQGTRFTIRLPFSLAVTQALLARVGESLFAIPLLSIELVTRLKESEFQAYLSGDPVHHRYNERNYPIHNLGLLIGGGQIPSFDEIVDRRPPTLLFRSAEASAALQVEAVLGNREIIVKPVGPQFNGVPGISGATVLGDGRVVVVLELAALVRNIGSQAQKQAESRALRVARLETRQEKINIVVVDDSITMRKVTVRILERHNIAVTTAKDGLDAVAMLQTQVPDLAILDIEMPRMDGFEVLAHVRNQPHLRNMPIIMVTSRGGEKHRERAMKLGVNDYLTKPYQEEQLMHSIREILGERALDLIT